jgi:hypothetical protein
MVSQFRNQKIATLGTNGTRREGGDESIPEGSRQRRREVGEAQSSSPQKNTASNPTPSESWLCEAPLTYKGALVSSVEAPRPDVFSGLACGWNNNGSCKLPLAVGSTGFCGTGAGGRPVVMHALM